MNAPFPRFGILSIVNAAAPSSPFVSVAKSKTRPPASAFAPTANKHAQPHRLGTPPSVAVSALPLSGVLPPRFGTRPPAHATALMLGGHVQETKFGIPTHACVPATTDPPKGAQATRDGILSPASAGVWPFRPRPPAKATKFSTMSNANAPVPLWRLAFGLRFGNRLIVPVAADSPASVCYPLFGKPIPAGATAPPS